MGCERPAMGRSRAAVESWLDCPDSHSGGYRNASGTYVAQSFIRRVNVKVAFPSVAGLVELAMQNVSNQFICRSVIR